MQIVKNSNYWHHVRRAAQALASDGCTGVLDFFKDGCLEHDIHYRTHQRLDGTFITREEADMELRSYIRQRSRFGKWSPMAWWRYHFIREFASGAWDHPPDEVRDARYKVMPWLLRQTS